MKLKEKVDSQRDFLRGKASFFVSAFFAYFTRPATYSASPQFISKYNNGVVVMTTENGWAGCIGDRI
jgi:hypothetical protein